MSAEVGAASSGPDDSTPGPPYDAEVEGAAASGCGSDCVKA